MTPPVFFWEVDPSEQAWYKYRTRPIPGYPGLVGYVGLEQGPLTWRWRVLDAFIQESGQLETLKNDAMNRAELVMERFMRSREPEPVPVPPVQSDLDKVKACIPTPSGNPPPLSNYLGLPPSQRAKDLFAKATQDAYRAWARGALRSKSVDPGEAAIVAGHPGAEPLDPDAYVDGID